MIAELANEQTHTVSEWIEWRRGDCPVPRGTLVQVQMRFESGWSPDENQPPRRAEAWGWRVDGADALDIMKYRVVEG